MTDIWDRLAQEAEARFAERMRRHEQWLGFLATLQDAPASPAFVGVDLGSRPDREIVRLAQNPHMTTGKDGKR